MSVIEYTDQIAADCTVEGIGAVNQKGGYISVKIKVPINSDDSAGAANLAGKLTTHLGNIARMTLQFSSVKSSSKASGDDDPDQLSLDDLDEEQP